MKHPKTVSARLRFCQRRLDNWLISYSFGPKAPTFVTPFFQSSTLKQRIIMLQKSATTRWALVKYGFSALLISSLFVFVAACEDQSKKEVNSQEPITVSGQVLANDGTPIPGASIIVQGLSRGTTTDVNGRYQIKTPANGTLVVAFMGHKSEVIPVAGKTTVNAKLVLGSSGGQTQSHLSDLLSRQPVDDGKGKIFTIVEKNPEFPGGMAALGEFLVTNIQYPPAASRAHVSGRVFISFVINTDGSLQDITILKGIGFGADEEAVRVMKAMPRWKPGTQDGKPVRVKYNLPINFQMPEK